MAKKHPEFNKIEEDYPTVKQFEFTMYFYDASRKAAPVSRTYKEKPRQQNYYKHPLECIYRECEGGGYDIADAVQHMVDNHLHKMRGERICQGTLKRRNSPPTPCNSHLEFILKTQYHDDNEPDAQDTPDATS